MYNKIFSIPNVLIAPYQDFFPSIEPLVILVTIYRYIHNREVDMDIFKILRLGWVIQIISDSIHPNIQPNQSKSIQEQMWNLPD